MAVVEVLCLFVCYRWLWMWSGCRCCWGEEEDGAIYGNHRISSVDKEHQTNVRNEVGSEPGTASHAPSVILRNSRAAQASPYGNTPIHTGMFGETLPATQEVLQTTVSLQQADRSIGATYSRNGWTCRHFPTHILQETALWAATPSAAQLWEGWDWRSRPSLDRQDSIVISWRALLRLYQAAPRRALPQSCGSLFDFKSIASPIPEKDCDCILPTLKTMKPLMSSSSSRGKDNYSPRRSSESAEFNVNIHPKPRNTRTRALILVASIAWLSVFALLFGIYHRLANYQKCNCEMNDVGSNLLVGEDVPIINKVARKYHYLEDKLDDDDFSVTDPVWADLFPGRITQELVWDGDWCREVGGGIVYLSQEYIESRRLPISTISPNRPGNKSVYEIAGYHSLHCVVSTRRQFSSRSGLWRVYSQRWERICGEQRARWKVGYRTIWRNIGIILCTAWQICAST